MFLLFRDLCVSCSDAFNQIVMRLLWLAQQSVRAFYLQQKDMLLFCPEPSEHKNALCKVHSLVLNSIFKWKLGDSSQWKANRNVDFKFWIRFWNKSLFFPRATHNENYKFFLVAQCAKPQQKLQKKVAQLDVVAATGLARGTPVGCVNTSTPLLGATGY